MIAKATEIKQKLLDIKHGKIKEGLGIGVPEFDEFVRLKRNFTLIIGHANVGKTTFIMYLFTLWAVKHKYKFLIWSSENSVESIVRKVIEFKMGKPIQTAHEDEITKALEWCDSYFKIIDVQNMYTYQEFLNEAQAVKDAWNYDALLCDPYNSLAKDKKLMRQLGGHEYDYEVASEFRLFSRNNNIAFFLNAHGNSEALRRTHKKGHEYEDLPQPLGMASVEGGSKWASRSDDVYCVHRYTGHASEWMYTHLHVLKVKETEQGGRCTSFESPLKLKMSKNNVGFEFLGRDLLHQELDNVKQIQF